MNKIVKFLVGAVLVWTTLTTVRIVTWSSTVAPMYMELTFETQRCNRFEAARNLDEMENKNGFEQTAPTCYFDEKSCDKIEELNNKYEKARAYYQKIWGWLPSFKIVGRSDA